MERLEVINLQLERMKKASQIAVGVSQSLQTVEGSAEYAQAVRNPILCFSYSTGEARLDSKNTLLVERAIIGLETKTIPYLRKREELIQNEINQIKNVEKIAGLNTEKLELQGLFQSLSLATRLPVSVIEARKHAIELRLQAIDTEINSLNNPAEIVSVKEEEIEQVEPVLGRRRRKEGTDTKIPEMSLMQLKLLEILETSTKENPLTADQIISFVYEKEMAANPGNAKMLKDRLYVLLPQLRKSMERRKDQRQIISVKTGDKYSARAYCLEQPGKPEVIEPVIAEPEGMPAVGEIVFFQPQEVVEVAEPELAFRIIDKKHAELTLPDGNIVQVRGESRIAFLGILVQRTNANNPIAEEEWNGQVYGDRAKTMNPSNPSVVRKGLKDILNVYGWTIDGLKTSHTDPTRYYLKKSSQRETQPEPKAVQKIEEIKELLFTEEDAAVFMGIAYQIKIKGQTLQSYLDPEMIKHGKLIMERVSNDGTSSNSGKRAIYDARIKVIDKLLTIMGNDSLDHVVGENRYSEDLQSFLTGFSKKQEQAPGLRSLLEELKDTGLKDMLYVCAPKRQGVEEVVQGVVEVKANTLEKHDPAIRRTINLFLDNIEKSGIPREVSSAVVSSLFHVKNENIEGWVSAGIVNPHIKSGHRGGYPVFSHKEIVVMLYKNRDAENNLINSEEANLFSDILNQEIAKRSKA